MGQFNHRLMEVAREAAGFSQEELAKRVDLTQATISRWEHGLFGPSNDDVRKLAEVLQRPASYFFEEGASPGGGLPVYYHRALSSAAPKFTARVNAKAMIRAMQLAKLYKCLPEQEQLDEFPDLPADQFRGNPKAVARALRAQWNLPSGPVLNLVELIELHGGVVIIEDLGCDAVDALCWWSPGSPKLFFMNSRKPPCRMRFSLAHELGHTVLHRHPTDPQRAEEEADAFAGEFLIPEREAAASFPRPLTLTDLARLKPWWRMSMAALAVQASNCDVISKAELGRLMADLRIRKWDRQEPLDIDREVGSRFAMLLRFPIDRLGWSRSELAESLYCTEQELEGLLGSYRPCRFSRADVDACSISDVQPGALRLVREV